MSFQDFTGSRTASRSPTGPNAAASNRPSSNHNTASMTMGQGALNQISESLLQYQRNVGILEKIVHSLTAASGNSKYKSNREELEMQYQAQVDVISQLGDRVHQQISDQKRTETNATIKTTLIKLERDFERVQKQADMLTSAVNRMQADVGNSTTSATTTDSSNAAYEEYQQQMQMQMQEDRLAEQIMREREDEIRQINRGMHQVNEIYKDLAHIVASQQDQVDAIETQMEDSRANAEAGLQQVEKANDNYGSGNCVIS